MIDAVSLWYGFLLFEIILISIIILYTKDLRFLYLIFFGALLGSVFDHSGVFLGFYSYNQNIDPVMIGGIPLTVSFAEGIGMSTIIFVFEFVLTGGSSEE